MMSILLRPEFEPQYASMLTLVMGLSVAQAVKELDVEVSIKWPNDVVVSRKKICGILTEMGLENGKIREVIIGIGINVNLEEIQDDLKDKATSLYLETGKKYDRNRVIGLIMEKFEKNYEKFVKTCDLSLMLDDYNAMLANRSQPVRILDNRNRNRQRGRTSGKSLRRRDPKGMLRRSLRKRTLQLRMIFYL